MNENEGGPTDLRPALGAFAAVAVLGLPLGWVWSRLAPPEVVRVAADGALVPLLGESEHRFDALALFVLLGFAAGAAARPVRADRRSAPGGHSERATPAGRPAADRRRARRRQHGRGWDSPSRDGAAPGGRADRRRPRPPRRRHGCYNF